MFVRPWKRLKIYEIRTFKQVYSVVLALLPILGNFKCPFTSTTIPYVIYPVFLIVLAVKLFTKKTTLISKELVFVYIYYIYFTMRAGDDYFTSITISIISTITILAIYNGFIDVKILYNTILLITILASILIILQQIVHLTFGIHIPMMSSFFLPDKIKGYDYVIRTGYSIGSSSYRPSAFFLEPSHFSSYGFIGLAIALHKWFKENDSLGKSLLISIGIIASTSSIGILLVLGCWIWAVFNNGNKKLIKRMIITLIAIIVLAIILLIMYTFNIMNMTMILGRILGHYDGYNAIEGRTFAYDWYLKNMTSQEKIWGIGYSNRLRDVYMTAYMTYRYTIGYVGIALLYLMILKSIKSLSDVSITVAIAYIGLTFAGGVNQIFNIVFYIGMTFVDTKRKSEIKGYEL